MPRVCPECGARFGDEVRRCPADGTPTVFISSEEALVGKVIDGRFTIKELLGVGGMGAVYRALQHSMDRDVAIKVLRPDLARNEQEVLRFFREARAASRLRSPHVITLYDFGQAEDGLLFIVMELLKGRPLSAELSHGPIHPGRAKRIILQVLEALSHAHSNGVLHRDLKPDNIFLVEEAGQEDFVKVLDFGIAKMMGSESGRLTETGMVVGTPAYMSPEQAMGKELDARSDLYSVGVILFEMLTGKVPYIANTPMGIVYKKISEKAPNLREAAPSLHVPDSLVALVASLLEIKPEDRPASAEEVRKRLLEIPLQEPTKATPLVPSVQTPTPRRPQSEVVRIKPISARPLRRPLYAFVAAIGVALVSLTAYLWFGHLLERPRTEQPPSEVATELSLGRISPPILPKPLAKPVKALFSSLRVGTEEEIVSNLKEAVEAIRQSRLKSFDLLALAVIHELRNHSALNDEALRDIATLATNLAPDLPDVYFFAAQAALDSGLSGLPWAIKHLFQGALAFIRHPPSLLSISSKLSLYLAFAFVAIVILVPITLLLRYWDRLVHDVGDLIGVERPSSLFALRPRRRSLTSLTSRHVSTLPAVGVVLILLLLPFAAGIGIVPGLLLGLAATTVYASRSEVVAGVLTCLFAASLWPLGEATTLAHRVSTTDGARAWRCLSSLCSEEELEALKAKAIASEDRDALLAFATHTIRARYDDTQALLSGEKTLATQPHQRDPGLLTLLGHIRLLLAMNSCEESRPDVGWLLGAERAYNEALRRTPRNKAALIGLALTERLLARRDAANEALRTLETIEGPKDLFERIGFESKTDTPCDLLHAIQRQLDLPLDPGFALYVRDASFLGNDLVLPSFHLLAGNLGAIGLTIVAIIALIAIFLATFVKGRGLTATKCPRCGYVSCPRCDLKTLGFDMCPMCLLEQVRPAFVDPRDVPSPVGRSSSLASLKRIAGLASSVPMPGLVQVAYGRPLRGIVLLALASLGLTVLFYPEPRMIVGDTMGIGRTWAGIFLYLGSGLLSFADANRSDRG